MRWKRTALLALASTLVAAAPHSAAVVAVSGSPQSAHAYAATGAAAYETDFAQPLVAHVAAGGDDAAKVRFRCEQPDCKLYILEAPSDFERSDPRTFTIGATARTVSARVSITTPHLGTYTVTLALADAPGDAAVYHLTAR